MALIIPLRRNACNYVFVSTKMRLLLQNGPSHEVINTVIKTIFEDFNRFLTQDLQWLQSSNVQSIIFFKYH